MAKKIALDALMMSPSRAGVGNYQYNLIQNLKNTPFEFDVYVSCDGVISPWDNINVIKVKEFKSSRERLMFQLFYFAGILNKKNYDGVHFLDYVTPLGKLNCPFAVTVHDLSFCLPLGYFSKKASFFKKMQVPRALLRSDSIVTVSDFTKREILRLFPKTDRNKIFPALLGVNPCATRNVPSVKSPFVLFVGTVEPRKNIITLIRAMEKVWERGLDARLVIAGKLGWLYDETLKYAKHSPYSSKIEFTGFVTDEKLENLYKSASLFAFPSTYEGFGLPPLEAMSRGVPVVSTSFASMPEALGDAPIYADNEQDMADAVSKILTDINLHKKLSEKSKEQSRTLNWSKTAEETLKIYERF